MQEEELAGLTAAVLWASFAIAVAFGALLQRTHFCTMGAVADIVNMGDWGRMRAWMLAMGVAIVGFNGLVGLGLIKASNSVYAGTQVLWLSAVLGGALFGFGMVLASGCGSKNLVRLGAGSLKSLVVLLTMGLVAYGTMRGALAVLRTSTLDKLVFTLPAGQDLPSLLGQAWGLPTPAVAWWLGLLVGGALIVFALARAEGRQADHLAAGLGLGALIVAVWWVSGHWGYLAEHPLTLEPAFLATNSRRMESFTFVAPVGYTLDWFMLFSDKLKVVTLGIVSVFGVVVGATMLALARGQFRWEGFSSTADTARHLVGASLMGFGGVTAMGCTVGQGLSGVSTLALGSFIAVGGIVAGAVAALRWQAWQLDRAG